MTPDAEQLDALRRLDEVLGDLASLLDAVPINGGVETRHEELRNEAAQLYGRVSELVGGGSISRFGRSVDTVQTVLGNASIGGLVELDVAGFYYECLVFFRSLVKQAIGRAEEAERRGRLAMSPDVAARWSWLIPPLERARRVVVAHPRFLNPLLHSVEGWPVYRFIAVVGTVGGFVTTVAAIIAAVVLVLAYLL